MNLNVVLGWQLGLIASLTSFSLSFKLGNPLLSDGTINLHGGEGIKNKKNKTKKNKKKQNRNRKMWF